jgi:hypothetical protein
MSDLGATADIGRPCGLDGLVAFDPFRTSVVRFCRDAQDPPLGITDVVGTARLCHKIAPRASPLAFGATNPLPGSAKPRRSYTAPHESEKIPEAVAKLPPDQLTRFRRWFTAFEAGRTDHADELDSTANKLGRLAGRAFAELKKHAKEL